MSIIPSCGQVCQNNIHFKFYFTRVRHADSKRHHFPGSKYPPENTVKSSNVKLRLYYSFGRVLSYLLQQAAHKRFNPNFKTHNNIWKYVGLQDEMLSWVLFCANGKSSIEDK